MLCRIGRSALRRIFALDGMLAVCTGVTPSQERFERAFDEAMSNGGVAGMGDHLRGQFGGQNAARGRSRALAAAIES
jgi:hypothetical protein